MIKIKNLTMRNFLSVGAVTTALNLDNHGLTLVLGSNMDTNGGLSRNGAGKTTVLQAISFALYGKALSKIKIPNLINNVNNKQMLVTIEFERDEHTYRIERGRKPDVMRFFIDNTEIQDKPAEGEQQGENRHTQEEIERIIGMSHTMFKHIVALNTYTDPFLRMRVSDQREVIEELFGVTQMSARADVLAKLIKITKENLRDEQARIKADVEANTRIHNQIANTTTLSASWTKNHAKTLQELSEEITAMAGIDYDSEITLFDQLEQWLSTEREVRSGFDVATREIDILKREIAALDADAARYTREAHTDVSAQVKRLEGEKTRKQRDHINILADIDNKRAELANFESDIQKSGKLDCICCGQELAGTDHLEIVLGKMRKNADACVVAISSFENGAASILAEISHIDQEIEHVASAAEARRVEFEAKAEAKLEAVKAPRAKLEVQQKLVNDFANELSLFPPRPETIFNTRDEVYKAKQTFDALVREREVEEAKADPYAAQIETFTLTLKEVNYDSVNEYDSLFKHQEFLLRLLTNKDSFIRKKIIDQNLAYLNSRLSYYLEKLSLPHEVKFMSDLSVEILLLGRDFDFEQLSRGEMNRVIMATSWSFRDVWESLNESFNLLFVDEMLDQGTDAQGVEAALGVLKAMARDRNKNVFLISHRDDLTARIDRILLVRKENGFTRFEEDALV
jgi:DNA repair exonuclease SbcCD ATPase subunit